MYEGFVLIQDYIRMVWRYRWAALVVATITCAGGWLSVLLLPNQYEVTTKIFLDTRSLLRPLLSGLALRDTIGDDAAQMMRRLLVRPNLETVARKTDMDLKAKSPEQLEALLANMANDIQISGTKRDNIFVIAYKNQDPKLATRVVEALLNIFVERSLGESRKDTSKSRRFIEEQIKDYEARLEAAEARLKEFKQRNVGLMPGEGQNYFSRLQGLSLQLSEAQLQLQEAQRRRDELSRQLRGVSALFEPEAAERMPHPLDARISNLETNLDQLLLQFTDKHPDVVSTRRVLGELKDEREADLAAAGDVSTSAEKQRVQNPIYQELKLTLGATEAEVAALQARVKEYQGRQAELGRLVDTIPKVEAELKRLNRDYEIDRRNYEELVKRRESLKISDEASQTTDDVQFNVIEPPREPLLPTSPDRPKLNAAVLLAGIGSGIGLALLFAMLRPAIYTKEGFEAISDIPVLGIVSRIWTRKEKLKRRMEVASFAVGCVCLLGVFVTLSNLEAQHVDLIAKIAGMTEFSKLSELSERFL